jgi:hypothetical protein
MQSRDGQSPALGFLTVVAHEQHGFFGGYLVLNSCGRPLEFHCTAPLKPNRAQEILYGPTLEPFLFGEQIGRALVEKSTVEVGLICTDLAAVLAVRDHVQSPVALVLPPDDVGQASSALRIDQRHAIAPSPAFLLGRNRLAVSTVYTDDRQLVSTAIEPLAEHFDLSEPFTRIRDAIDEAKRGAK